MDPADAPPSRPSRSRRGLFGVLAALVVELGIGATLVAAIVALLTSEPGLRTAVALVQRLAPVTIECDGVSGALNRDFAIDAREKVAEREPTNRSNRIALAIMYIDKRDFEKSRPLIDALRKEADELNKQLNALPAADPSRKELVGKIKENFG